jgi:branched-chain amino acid transport system ATP-binding protein
MNILETYQLTKRFGGLVAVNQVSIQVPEGSIISIIGPNGAGKTTFFNCITGFYAPDEGNMVFDGQSLLGYAPDRVTAQGISRTYQNIRLFPTMTAIENILVGRHPRLKTSWIDAVLHTPRYKNDEADAIKKARSQLNFVGLGGLGDQLARNLPYGAQRRLELARALASDPKLILLDEPTAGMNPHESTDMMHFIQHLRTELGITILLIEHDMRVVMGISEHIYVLDFGTLIAEGTPQEIQGNPQVIEAYLGRGAASGLQEHSAAAVH